MLGFKRSVNPCVVEIERSSSSSAQPLWRGPAAPVQVNALANLKKVRRPIVDALNLLSLVSNYLSLRFPTEGTERWLYGDGRPAPSATGTCPILTPSRYSRSDQIRQRGPVAVLTLSADLSIRCNINRQTNGNTQSDHSSAVASAI